MFWVKISGFLDTKMATKCSISLKVFGFVDITTGATCADVSSKMSDKFRNTISNSGLSPGRIWCHAS